MKRAALKTVEIEHAKLASYLLNIHHPAGKSKARFFIGHGFRPSEPKLLADALFEHLGSPASSVRREPHPKGYGHILVCRGPMPMPNGKTKDVLSVWLMHWDRETVTFVSARPD